MIHNDGMPEKKYCYVHETNKNKTCNSCQEFRKLNRMHDAFTKILNEPSVLTVHILRNWDRNKIEGFAKHLLGDQYLAERKTMAVGKCTIPSCECGGDALVAPPTEKNTPEKKLVEKISFYKLLTLVRDHRNKYNGIDVSKYDLDNETDRRNLGLAIQQIYEEIYKTFAIPDWRVPTYQEAEEIASKAYMEETKLPLARKTFRIIYEALFAKTEEKK